MPFVILCGPYHSPPPEYSTQHFSLTGLFGTKVVPARSAHGDGGSAVVSGCFPPTSQRSSSCAAVERDVAAAAASPLHPSSPCNGAAAASAAHSPCSPMKGGSQQLLPEANKPMKGGAHQQLPAEANKAMKGSPLQIMRSSMSFCPLRSLVRPRSSSTECPADFTLVGRAGSALNLMHRAGSSTRNGSVLPQPGPAPWDSDTQMLVLKVRGGCTGPAAALGTPCCRSQDQRRGTATHRC